MKSIPHLGEAVCLRSGLMLSLKFDISLRADDSCASNKWGADGNERYRITDQILEGGFGFLVVES